MAQARVGVVGGGLGGLAAACVLAARGHAVTLFERSAWLGGKAAVLQEQGYRFDLVADRPAMCRNLEALAPGSGQGYGAFLDFSKKLHEISERFFFWRSIGS